jgi:K+-transporting ATPase ATPase C chain
MAIEENNPESGETIERAGKVKKTSHIRPLIGISLVALLMCGLFFPLLVTGIAQTTMPYQANGEIVQLNGHAVGSNLIDNGFTLPIFFHARNESNPLAASASGVDPDINIADALSQIPRISSATNISSAALTQIVYENEEGIYWIVGSPYVSVLRLNLVLINNYPTVYSNFTA